MKLSTLILFILLIAGCKSEKPKPTNESVHTSGRTTKTAKVEVPNFDGSNAFRYLETQVSFGPRVPNTDPHKQCLDYLRIELSKYADAVDLQNFSDNAYGKILSLTNVIAKFNPTATKRILLCAHWDSHPWASHDANPVNRNTPIPGANDGASGVAVLLEIARILKANPPTIGVDIVLFDGEDYAKANDLSGYLRGSKYFARTKPANYNPDYGILLDMIGDAELEIPKEGFSVRYAPDIVQLVWETARNLNITQFKNEIGPEVIDDHLPLNEVGIKTINLIDFNYPDATHRYWHTLDDTPDKCAPESLEAVGVLLLNLIYRQY